MDSQIVAVLRIREHFNRRNKKRVVHAVIILNECES